MAPLAVEQVGIAPRTVRRAIRHLEDMGIVREITGKKRHRAFEYEDYWLIPSRGIGPAS